MSIHGLKLSHIKTSFCFHCPSWSSEGFFIAAFSFLLFFSRSKRAIEIQSHFTSMEQIQQFINLKHFSRIISHLLITMNPFQRTVRTKGSFTNRQNFQTQPFSSICNPEEEIRVTESKRFFASHTTAAKMLATASSEFAA